MANLLFIAERFPPDIGGVAASGRRISRALARIGHRVDVFVLAREIPAGRVDSREISENFTVHRFGPAKNLDFTLQQALNFLEWLQARRSFDAVWGHYVTTAGFLATWFGRLSGVPSIVSVRGNDFDRQLFPPGDFGRLQWCLSTCDQIATVSRDLATKVRALTRRNATVLPNSVDTDLFHPGEKPDELVARYELRSDELVLGFSGELRAKKGLDFLLRAFYEVASGQPVRLLIIGEVRPQDQGQYERAVAAASAAGDMEMQQQIVLTGHLESPRDVARHLRLIDVFVLPSLWDGMPNSLLEAMAVGLPVVASDAGAIPEVITDRENGMLVPKTHLHQVAAHIDELMAMPGDQRSKLAGAARRHVCDHHSLAAEEARLSALVASLAKSES